MAIYDVRPSGGAYTTQIACEAAVNTGTLSGEVEGQYQGDWSASSDAGGQLTIAGGTATSSNYYVIGADSSNTALSAWTTARARMIANVSSELIRCAQAYTRIRGIQAENTGTGDRTMQHFSSADVLADSIFMRGRGGFSQRTAGQTGYAVNTLSANGGTQTLRKGGETNNATATGNFYWCVSANGGTNASFLITAATAMTCIGCVAYGHSIDSFLGSIGGDYNASDRADAPGGNSLQSIGDPFTNYAGGDFSLNTGDPEGFIGAGGTPPTGTSYDSRIAVDAFGTTRLDPTTIGREELGGASDPPSDGDATVDVGASGTATAESTTDGAADVAVTAAGDGSAVAAADGTTSIAVTGAAEGTYAVQVDGAASVQVTTSGASSSTGAADGAASVDVSAAGEGTAEAYAVGAITVSIGCFGSGEAETVADGQADVTVGASGTASGGNGAQGTASVQVGASGVAEGTQPAAGVSGVSVVATGASEATAASQGAAQVAAQATGTGSAQAQADGSAAVAVTAAGSSGASYPDLPPGVTWLDTDAPGVTWAATAAPGVAWVQPTGEPGVTWDARDLEEQQAAAAA